MKKKVWIMAAVLMSFSLSGCSLLGNNENSAEEKADTQAEEVSRDLFAMDTFMNVTAYGDGAEEAVEKAANEIVRLDELLSTGKESSEVYAVNENGEGILSADTAYLLKRSMDLYTSTEGVFDIAVYPIMQAWGFPSGEYEVPTEETLQELLPLTDMTNISYHEDTKEIVFAVEGMQIDFGGIAKGYTSSRLMDIYRECGVKSGMVNLGGNVQVLGTKPDGSLWKVGIESPDKEDYLGILSTRDRAVITSGGYERYFEENGILYHHIIDPSTGYPADSGLLSVTIVSEDGILADGLSTSLFIMGKEKAIAYWKDHCEEFDVILLTEDEKLYVTEGIAEDFSSDRKVEIVERGDKK
ncbi:MAG: FAD:protein FMN transferase [Lachnospiraceae bacterium]